MVIKKNRSGATRIAALGGLARHSDASKAAPPEMPLSRTEPPTGAVWKRCGAVSLPPPLGLAACCGVILGRGDCGEFCGESRQISVSSVAVAIRASEAIKPWWTWV